ncbi:MAG: LCP family protein [Acidimicrobiales bacterium]|jgi:LCP family protein required for cell wall assembly
MSPETDSADAGVRSPRGRFIRRRRRIRPPRKHPWRHRLAVVAASLVVLVGLLVGAGYGYVAYRNHQIHHIVVRNLTPVATKPGPAGGPEVGVQTFLMIGSTSRCALPTQNPVFGTCAGGITGVNSDVILLLRADQNTHTISVLSIPRDLVLEGVRDDDQRFYKIDAALAEGPSQLVAVIEQDFGIPINHFVELNFDSFQGVVKALGGINMYFPFAETDSYSTLDIKTPGCHHLNGFEALAVVRARHLSYDDNGTWDYDGSGDLGRIIRVHEFLRVLAAAMQQQGLDNPLRDNAIIGAIAPQLTVDSGLSITDMVNLILAFHGVNPLTAPEATLPNIEDHDDYLWNGIDFGSVVLPAYPQDQQAIDAFEGLSSPPGARLAPKAVSVSVVSGAETDDDTVVASHLRSLGYHVVGESVSSPVGPISQAIVYYARGHQLEAERLLQSLHGIVSMAEGPTQDGADVTLVTGSNFSVTPQHHAGRQSGATTTTVPNPYPVLGPPSAAVQALPFYDPRACPIS